MRVQGLGVLGVLGPGVLGVQGLGGLGIWDSGVAGFGFRLGWKAEGCKAGRVRPPQLGFRPEAQTPARLLKALKTESINLKPTKTYVKKVVAIKLMILIILLILLICFFFIYLYIYLFIYIIIIISITI